MDEGAVCGEWTVLRFSHKANNKGGNAYWLCRCSCGREKPVLGTSLRTGKSTKCHRCSGKDNGRIGLDKMAQGKDVYFIRCGDYVKVGCSSDIKRRIKDLEGSNPYPLKLICIAKNEKFWHTLLEPYHHRGEWYYLPIGE